MSRRQGFHTRLILLGLLVSFACSSASLAGIFGTVRGIVHDVQHRPISGAHLLLQAKQSDWKRAAFSDDNGEFQIDAVPAGTYTLQIAHDGFRESFAELTVVADSAPLRHFPLEVGPDRAGRGQRIRTD